MEQIDIQPILQASIDLLAEYIWVVLFPIVLKFIDGLKARLNEYILSQPENIRKNYEYAAKIATISAEVAGRQLALDGKAKLSYALQEAESTLKNTYGYKSVNFDTLRGVIEKILSTTTEE